MFNAQFKEGLKAQLQDWWSQLRSRHKYHWMLAFLLIVLGMLAGEGLDAKGVWIELRYQCYQSLYTHTPHHKWHAKRTVMVLIKDNDYWEGELGGRVPIRRDFLAKLIQKLAEKNPQLIALDFDLRSPVPDKNSQDQQVYAEETNKLLGAINYVSQSRIVILPRTISFKHGGDDFVPDPAIYDGQITESTQLGVGYISLPADRRRIPLAISKGADQEVIPSFAGAIVKRIDEQAYQDAQGGQVDALPFGTYLKPDQFRTFSSSDILTSNTKDFESDFAGKIVIVGGAWHQDADNRGEVIDEFITPIGKIGGAYIHANYVEALLDSRTYSPMGKVGCLIIEGVISIFVALFFGLDFGFLAKLAAIFCLSTIFIGISYFSLQNLGVFFDFFIPVVFLTIHLAIEQWLKLKEELRELQQKHKTDQTTAPTMAEVGA